MASTVPTTDFLTYLNPQADSVMGGLDASDASYVRWKPLTQVEYPVERYHQRASFDSHWDLEDMHYRFDHISEVEVENHPNTEENPITGKDPYLNGYHPDSHEYYEPLPPPPSHRELHNYAAKEDLLDFSDEDLGSEDEDPVHGMSLREFEGYPEILEDAESETFEQNMGEWWCNYVEGGEEEDMELAEMATLAAEEQAAAPQRLAPAPEEAPAPRNQSPTPMKQSAAPKKRSPAPKKQSQAAKRSAPLEQQQAVAQVTQPLHFHPAAARQPAVTTVAQPPAAAASPVSSMSILHPTSGMVDQRRTAQPAANPPRRRGRPPANPGVEHDYSRRPPQRQPARRRGAPRRAPTNILKGVKTKISKDKHNANERQRRAELRNHVTSLQEVLRQGTECGPEVNKKISQSRTLIFAAKAVEVLLNQLKVVNVDSMTRKTIEEDWH